MSSSSRRVLITGGGRGIGRAIADLFRARGHQVLAPSREELDLANPEAVQEFLSAAPEVDVLINNAAENRVRPLDELSSDDWDRMVAINLTAPLRLMQHVARGMGERGWGRIVNIASCYALVSRPGRAGYAATKAGLGGLTRTAALEYGPRGVLVNAVCPGFVATDLTRQNNSPEQIAALCAQVPLGRLAEPEEIARYVHFLGSDENTYITGQLAIIDGGFLCQ